MTNSMTAFSRIEGEGFLWEIRSENYRGLDIRIKLPDDLQTLEFELVKAVRSSIARGKVYVSFKENRLPGNNSNWRESNLARLTHELDSLVQSLPPKVTPSVDLLTLLRSSDNDSIHLLNEAYDFSTVKISFNSALEAFQSDRRREGEELKQIVLKKLRCCQECATKLGKLRDEQVSMAQLNMEQRLEVLNAQVDPQRLAQEVALIAQKSDFSEELDRLNVHLDEIESRLSDDLPSGRRLVFLAQELAREANTLASKSQSGDCSLLAVDLKVHVDQIREQVQNIE